MGYMIDTTVWYGVVLTGHEDPCEFLEGAEDALSAAGVSAIEVAMFGVVEVDPSVVLRIEESVTREPAHCAIEIESLRADEQPAWDAMIRETMELLNWPDRENARIGWHATTYYG